MKLGLAGRAVVFSLAALAVAASVCAVYAPAAWLSPALSHASRGTLSFHESWGTAWAGAARIKITRSDKETLVLAQPLHWRLDASSVWHGNVVLALTSADLLESVAQPVGIRVEKPWRTDAVAQISQGRFLLPVQSLASLGAPFNTLRLSGQAQLVWSALTLALNAPPKLQNPVSVRVSQLKSTLTGDMALGDYALDIRSAQADADVLALSLSTTSPSAALILAGTGKVSIHSLSKHTVSTQKAPTRPQFDLRASAKDADAMIKLGALLNFLGRRQGDEWVLRVE